MGALQLEKIEYWINVLLSALECLPRLNLNSKVGGIDDVNYADIVNTTINTPESTTQC